MDADISSQAQKPLQQDEITIEEVYEASRRRAMLVSQFYKAPWWLLILVTTGILIAIGIATNDIYAQIYDELKEGISMTLGVSFFAYTIALVIALIVGLIRINPPAPPNRGASIFKYILSVVKLVVYNISTIYVEVLRGLPVLVVLLVTAFVLVPIIREPFLIPINETIIPALENLSRSLNNVPEFPTHFQTLNFETWTSYLRLPLTPDFPEVVWRGSSAPSAIAALSFTYGAYMSEIIRAGIQSVGRGQVEAAKSLGMTYAQTMRFIVLPQAFRNVLPPLGNDVVAMIKDSSLLAIIGVRDITQIAKTSSGRSFRYLETYLVVAVLYLTMTVIGSVIVKAIEDTLSQERETPLWVRAIGNVLGRFRGKRKQTPKPETYTKESAQ